MALPSTRHHSFGELVRRHRRALDWTQAQLADRVACSEDMVRKIEADLRRPSRWLAERLLNHLQIDAGERPAALKAARVGVGVSERGTTSAAAAETAHASPPLVVGRAAEMAALRERVAAARGGTGSMVLIEGEAGIGKSYLAQAALAEVAPTGFMSCATACYEIDRAIPLQPLIDWTHRMLDLLGPQVLDELSAGAQAELADLSPQVRELKPKLAAGGAPELRRSRIFGAFAELVMSRLKVSPLLIVIDDIHWADEMTLSLLHLLGRHARGTRLVVVCTYRSEELAGNEALALFVRSAHADLGVPRLQLSRWGTDDVRALLDAQGLGGRAELAARLARSSEGHPLYLASMLQQLHDTDTADDAEPALPQALRDSIRERLRRLPPQARAILDIAAVLGRRFDFFALERGAGIAGGALADAVDLLQERRLLREIDDGASFDFGHHRIREVVYDDLGAARRIVLHRRAAEALADGDDADDNAAAIAEHCELAGQWADAMRHHERAARRSLALSALREASRAVDRALALFDSKHPAGVDGGIATRLHELRGDVHAQDGRSADAVASFETALAGARADGDAARTRDLLTKLGMAYRRADDYARASDCLAQSLAASRALNEHHRVADTLYHLGTVAWSDGDNALALACHGEAVQLCETRALHGLVAVQAWHGDGEGHFADAAPLAAIERFERSLALARALRDRGYEAENLMMLGYCCTGSMGIADYARAERHAVEGIGVAEAAEQHWHLLPLALLQADAWRCTGGRMPDAAARFDEQRRRAESLGHPRFAIMALDMLGRLHHECGRHDEAEACFASAAESGSAHKVNFWRAQVLAGLAQARLHLGFDGIDWAALRSASDAALARRDRYVHARCLAVLAEGALHAGDDARARDDATRLLALAEPAGMRELQAIAHWLLGRSWLAESPRQAGAEYAAALQGAARIGRPWLAMQVHRSMAELCERSRRRAKADEHRAAAEAEARRLDPTAATESIAYGPNAV